MSDEVRIDRRDGLRRRIYLCALVIGIPVQLAVWLEHRAGDPFIAVAHPLYALSQVVVLVGLLRRRMDVRTAERIVLLGTVLTYLTGLAVSFLTAPTVEALREQTTVVSLLTITLMPMLAHVAYDTRRALQLSLAIVAAYGAILAVRLVPVALAGQLGGEAVDYLSLMVFLGTSVGLLHVMAQVKEQAAEARLTASAMETLANTDALTGIANRRHLRDALDDHLASEVGPLAVVLLDIDHFKRINDLHGHDVGDEVLQMVASTLSAQIRSTDVLGRWGGEEFLVIAPDTDAVAAAALAERCRAALAAAAMPVGTVTASLGVANRRPGERASGVLRRADVALYLAKAGGRNRVLDETGSDAVGRVAAARSTKSTRTQPERSAALGS